MYENVYFFVRGSQLKCILHFKLYINVCIYEIYTMQLKQNSSNTKHMNNKIKLGLI
jgi:hypothetical protein